MSPGPPSPLPPPLRPPPTPAPMELEDNFFFKSLLELLLFSPQVVRESLGCELFQALSLRPSWKRMLFTPLPSTHHSFSPSGISSFTLSLQSRVEAEHCPGLLDIRSGTSVREPPDFALFQATTLSWELAGGHQGPAGSDHVLRPLFWPVVRGSPLPDDRRLPPDLEKGWLAFSGVFWRQD